jgi:hypothetical protein
MWALAAFGPRSSIWAGGPSLFGPASTTRSFRVSAGRAMSGRLVGRGGREHPRRLGCDRGTAGGGGRRFRPDARDCADRRRGELVLDSIQLWNEKRATAQVSAFSAANDVRCPLATDRQSAFGRLGVGPRVEKIGAGGVRFVHGAPAGQPRDRYLRYSELFDARYESNRILREWLDASG